MRINPTQNNGRYKENIGDSHIVNRRHSAYQNFDFYSSQRYDKKKGNARLLNEWKEQGNATDRAIRGQVNSRSNYVQRYQIVGNRNRMGCYNCGEFNHVQSNCRYDHKINVTYVMSMAIRVNFVIVIAIRILAKTTVP